MRFALFFLLFASSLSAQAQLDKFSPRDAGAVSVHGGSILFINTASLTLSTPDLLRVNNHHLRINVGAGLFHAVFFGVEKGLQLNGVLEYYAGKNGNHFELDLGVIGVQQHDANDDALPLIEVKTSPRVFIGYRYESTETPIFFKAGLGFVEVLQLGFGYRFARKTSKMSGVTKE